MRTSKNGIKLITSFEGLVLSSYYDSAGVLTIGYGHTGPDVFLGQSISEYKAESLLKQDLIEAESCIKSNVTVKINQNQFDALTSFIFNLGCGNFIRSGLLRSINNDLFDEVPFEISRWNKARNKDTGELEVLRGLTRRRADEAQLFMTPVNVSPLVLEQNQTHIDKTIYDTEPSRVRKERDKLSESRTIKAGGGALGGGVVTGVTQILSKADNLVEKVSWFDDILAIFFIVGISVTILSAIIVLYCRWNDYNKAGV